MVGDKLRDIEAGEAAGVKGIQIPLNSPLLQYVPQLMQAPEAI
jgi:phosphoglycolate phosphatase-like HAD superfamily hydrolase